MTGHTKKGVAECVTKKNPTDKDRKSAAINGSKKLGPDGPRQMLIDVSPCFCSNLLSVDSDHGL